MGTMDGKETAGKGTGNVWLSQMHKEEARDCRERYLGKSRIIKKHIRSAYPGKLHGLSLRRHRQRPFLRSLRSDGSTTDDPVSDPRRLIERIIRMIHEDMIDASRNSIIE